MVRTAIYEHAAAGSPTAEDLAKLAKEHRQRLAYWSFTTPSGFPRWILALPYPLNEFLLFMIVAILLSMATWTVKLGVWPLVVVSLIAALFLYGRARNRRVDRTAALHDQKCPDCGYDLSAAVPAIAPDLLGGQTVGPRLCPECGAPWPLVPPRVPDSAPSQPA